MKRKRKKRNGPDLLEHVIRLTGLPGQNIRRDLKEILERKGIDIDHLTLEQLRLAAASYLREIMSSLVEKQRPKERSIPPTKRLI